MSKGPGRFGDKIFIADMVYGLLVVDIASPASPVLLSIKINGINVAPVAHLGDVVYTGTTELVVVDISDPANPVHSG